MKLKIAVIGPRGIDSDYSGIEKTVREVFVRLVKRGHEVTIFSQSQENGIQSYQGVKIVRISSLNGKHTETLSRSAVATLKSLGNHFDVINYHAEGPAIFCCVSKLFNKKSVVTIHGLDWKRAKWSPFAKIALKMAEKVAVKWADRIVVVSRNLEQYFYNAYGIKTVQIPNGMSPKDCGEANGKTFEFDRLKKNDYILFASRLVPEKGCLDLIKAFNEIPTDKKLVIAGNGLYQDKYMEQLKATAKPDKVIFLGHVDRKQLEQLFSNAYLFVLPSYIEGLSNALLESLENNVCPLVSDIPENLEVVGSKGFSFKVGDLDDLKVQLAGLINNPSLVEKGKFEMSKYVKEKYCWNKIVDQYENTFLGLAGLNN